MTSLMTRPLMPTTKRRNNSKCNYQKATRDMYSSIHEWIISIVPIYSRICVCTTSSASFTRRKWTQQISNIYLRLQHPLKRQLIEKVAHLTNATLSKKNIRKQQLTWWWHIVSFTYRCFMVLKFRDEIEMTRESDTAELFSHFSYLGVPFWTSVTSIRHGKMHLAGSKVLSRRIHEASSIIFNFLQEGPRWTCTESMVYLNSFWIQNHRLSFVQQGLKGLKGLSETATGLRGNKRVNGTKRPNGTKRLAG